MGQSPPILDLCVKACLISGPSVSQRLRGAGGRASAPLHPPPPPPHGSHLESGWSSGCSLPRSRLESMVPFVFVFCGHFQADSETPIKMLFFLFSPPRERFRVWPGTAALISEGYRQSLISTWSWIERAARSVNDSVSYKSKQSVQK